MNKDTLRDFHVKVEHHVDLTWLWPPDSPQEESRRQAIEETLNAALRKTNHELQEMLEQTVEQALGFLQGIDEGLR